LITLGPDKNQAAFWRLKPELDARYPKGRYVAFHDGEIIADAATYEELDAVLAPRRLPKQTYLIIRAGLQYPEFVTIL